MKIDPRTLAVREVVSRPDTPEFGAGTALVEVGDTLWVGSFRGNRIAIVALTPLERARPRAISRRADSRARRRA